MDADERLPIIYHLMSETKDVLQNTVKESDIQEAQLIAAQSWLMTAVTLMTDMRTTLNAKTTRRPTKHVMEADGSQSQYALHANGWVKVDWIEPTADEKAADKAHQKTLDYWRLSTLDGYSLKPVKSTK